MAGSSGVDGSTKPSSDIHAQVFDADGSKLGAELLVNTTTHSTRSSPPRPGCPMGGFVVTWANEHNVASSTSRGQVFDADGTKSGGEFTVNMPTIVDDRDPVITALSDGRFVVTWDDDANGDIRAQIFNADGTKSGGEFLVDTDVSTFRSSRRSPRSPTGVS